MAKSSTIFYYYVKSWNAAGASAASNTATTQAEIGMEANQELADLSLDFGESLPDEYGLLNCYPNPANPGTTIQFQLPEPGNVELKIISVTGRAVKTLVSGQRMAGIHQVTWNGHDEHDQPVSTGMYFYTMRAGGQVFSKKFSLLK